MSKRIASPKGTDRVQAEFVIRIHENGALSVSGPIDDKAFALAVLENAKDAIRNHRASNMVDVVIPQKNISLP